MYRSVWLLKLGRWMPLLGSEATSTPESAEMPHLHLPMDHTDADLVLAANLADIVGSEDLYVAWTQDTGAGVPEIEAYLSDETPASPFGEFMVALTAGCVAFWRALTGGSAGVAAGERSERGAARQIEPSA
jgi:hypothetical protein